MQTQTFQRVSAWVLGAGSVAFGVWALARPQAFASFMGSDPSTGRLTGVRDLVIGSAMISRQDRGAFLVRALADAWDAGTVSKSNVSTGAAAFALWAATAALACRTGQPHQGGAA